MILDEIQERNNIRINELKRLISENKATPLVAKINEIYNIYCKTVTKKGKSIQSFRQAAWLKIHDIIIRKSKAYTQNFFNYYNLICELKLRMAIERYISSSNTMEDVIFSTEYNYYIENGRQLHDSAEVDYFDSVEKIQAFQDIILSNIIIRFTDDEKEILKSVTQDIQKEGPQK